ncbi:putative protein cornichon [Paratrimastix pyriformis]|uniref:Cornichon n=1 Tax=Paratrimastix pyriformis TaxID=342808 RepID=A0ABQ8UNJ4_9EUKA|nr:putative protein cornichon [Paratrimastix pyriformis]
MALLEIFVTVISFIGSIALIFNQIYLLVALGDLSSDIMGPIDFCQGLEPFVIPEYIVQGVITLLYLAGHYWIGFLINVPLAYYHFNMWFTKRGQKRFDYTRIRRTEVIQHENKLAYLKLGFYLVLFLLNLYWLVMSLVHHLVPSKV